MLYDQKQDKPQTAFKQVFGPVLKAHLDFVRPEANAAQCVLTLPYSFADTIGRYSLRPTGHQLSSAATQLFNHEDLAFFMYPETPSTFRFFV
ncbi:MAG: hypothetical protein ACREBW_09865, partial [Candidatus Micrarchaeaceae archaeon]